MLVTKVTCPQCHASLKATDDVLGKKIKCLKCGERFRVTDEGVGEPCRSEGSSNSTIPVAAPYLPPPAPIEVAATFIPPPSTVQVAAPYLPPPDTVQVAAPYLPPPAPIEVAATFIPPPGTVQVAAPYLPPPAATLPDFAPETSEIHSGPPPEAAAPAPIAAAFVPPPDTPRSRAWQMLLLGGGLALFLAIGLGLALYCFLAGDSTPQVAQTNDPFGDDQVLTVLDPKLKSTPLNHPPQASQEPDNQPKQGDATSPAPQPVEPAQGGQNDPEPKKPVPPPRPFQVAQEVNGAFAVTKEQQALISTAIDRGVLYLRRTQTPSGGWGAGRGAHAVGYAALPGLTLLECGVPATDTAVVKAAKFVRFNSGTLNHTYDLALAVLFLDKLGDWRDRVLIQTLAGRLIAGQDPEGGWTYTCPVLNQQENLQLLTFLKTNRPVPLMDPLRQGGGIPDLKPLGSGQPNPLPAALQDLNPFEALPILLRGQQKPDALPNPLPDGGGSGPGQDTKLIPPGHPGENPKLIKSLPQDPAGTPVAKGEKPTQPPKNTAPKRPVPMRADALPPSLRKLAVVAGPGMKGFHMRDDNSNTQFAMMALWAARRHGVPMERTLYLIHKRFTSSQAPDGHWGYLYQRTGGSPAMTCVGLIGMAIGHGNVQEMIGGPGGAAPADEKNKQPAMPSLQDPTIENGLRALGRYVENPVGRRGAKMTNLYFLWSLERVAVLYNLKTIGNKNWYGWASELLVQNQNGDGSWLTNSYPGSSPTIDTCLALLILRRANLVQDLTDNLRLYLAISDPDGGSHSPRR